MPLVLFNISFDTRDPKMLFCDARAVPAEPCAQIEDDPGNPGGVTRRDIADVDIRTLGAFEDGAEDYVESDAGADVLDDADEATERLTRIWWRATIGGVGS